MKTHRDQMVAALKSRLVPELRSRGFKGSFPHFHRAGATRADFLTVQFYSLGGSFVVEIAACGPNGIESGYASELPVAKLNTHHFRERLRLGSDPAGRKTDPWFHFGPSNLEPPRPLARTEHYEAIAARVAALVASQGEPWWAAATWTDDP
jgi:hypothetical protein